MDTKVLSPYKNIIIGLVIIVVFARITQGIISQYSLKKEETVVKTQELEEGERTIEKWRKLKRDSKELAIRFLTEDSLFFKKFVEEKANSLGIKITSLNTSSEEKDLYWEVTMQLGMACSYKDFTAFVKAMEEKGVVIERVTIANSREDKGEAINLALKGFIIKE